MQCLFAMLLTEPLLSAVHQRCTTTCKVRLRTWQNREWKYVIVHTFHQICTCSRSAKTPRHTHTHTCNLLKSVSLLFRGVEKHTCIHLSAQIEAPLSATSQSPSPVSCPCHSAPAAASSSNPSRGGSCLFEGGGRWHRLPSEAVITLKSKMAALGNRWTSQ